MPSPPLALPPGPGRPAPGTPDIRDAAGPLRYPLVKDFSSSPLTAVPFVVTSDFTGPIPFAHPGPDVDADRDPRDLLCQRVFDDRRVVGAGRTVTVAGRPRTVTWVVTLRAWPAIVAVIAIVLVRGWPESICAWLADDATGIDLERCVAQRGQRRRDGAVGAEQEGLLDGGAIELVWGATWLPPATGTTAVILSVAARRRARPPSSCTPRCSRPPPGTAPSRRRGRRRRCPRPRPPAGDHTDEETADVDEPDEQPARASAAAASSVAQPADMREMERWRFMAQPFRGTSVGMVRRGGRVAGDSRGALVPMPPGHLPAEFSPPCGTN